MSRRSVLAGLGATWVAALALPAPALAQWTTVREEDGIVVESQSVPGRALPVLRGVTTIDATAEQILAWIGNVPSYTEWMHNCEEARQLRTDGRVTLVYNRIASPWPVSDRDVVLRNELVKPLEGGAARVEFRDTQEVAFSPDSSVVRMPRLIGHFDLRPDPGGGTHVEYQLDADPGGSVPAWLVARTTRELPYFTLRNLRAKVEAGD